MHGDYKLGIMILYRADVRVPYLVGVHCVTGERVVYREATDADYAARLDGRISDWTRDQTAARAWDRLADNAG